MIFEPNLSGALRSLAPGASFVSQNTGDLEADYAATEWLDDSEMPTLAAVQAELNRIKSNIPDEATYEALVVEQLALTEYQRLRAPEYPPLTDLADAIYWQQQGDDSKMAAYVAACEAVKAKYPKPE